MTGFLLVLAAMAAVGAFVLWFVSEDTRGDAEAQRIWDERPSRKAGGDAGLCTMDGPARPPVCGEVCDTCPIPTASPTDTGDPT